MLAPNLQGWAEEGEVPVAVFPPERARLGCAADVPRRQWVGRDQASVRWVRRQQASVRWTLVPANAQARKAWAGAQVQQGVRSEGIVPANA